MVSPLPARPNLDWLRKTAKQRLTEMRRTDPAVKLADAQLAVAREHGFSSWRTLKAHVDRSSRSDTPESEVAHFFRAVADGKLDVIRAALDAAPELLHAVGPHPFWGGRPQALHVAIERKRREVIDLLLERGADVNGLNDGYESWSPLMLAASQPDVARDLIRRGARVSLPEALMLGDDARVDELLARDGIPPQSPAGASWLAFARTPHAIDALLAHGVRADVRDRWGATAIDALSRLDDRGAGLLRHLASRGTPPTPAALARIGDLYALAAVAADEPSGVAADHVLLAAVDGSQVAVVRWLLAHGARAGARAEPPSRHTALHAAAWNGNLAIAEMLVEAGADVAARDAEHDGTPLGWAETSMRITGKPGCAEVAEYLRTLRRSQARREHIVMNNPTRPDLDRIAADFDARAKSYNDNRWHRILAEQLVARCGLAAGQRVLDAATGTGFAALAAARAVGREGAVIGVDISRGMLAEARRAAGARDLAHLEWHAADATRLPDDWESRFDVVTCVAGLLYMDVAAALGEWRRVLRPGGRVAFTSMAAGSPPAGELFRQCAAHFGVQLEDPSAALGTPEACRMALANAGFADVAVESGTVRFGAVDHALAWESNMRSAGHAAVRQLPEGALEKLRSRYERALEHESRERQEAFETATVLYVIGRRQAR